MLDRLLMPVEFTLRVADERDHSFMTALFRSVKPHLLMIDLPMQQRELLVDHQYQLQQNTYKMQWPCAVTFIVQYRGESIGKVVLHEELDLLHIIDIALTPAHRGQGYGTAMLTAFSNMADQHTIRLRLSVERNNCGAKKWYLALGFEVVEEGEFYLAMKREPSLVS